MKNFRTKKSNRGTYRYYFVTGDMNEIEVSSEIKDSDIALLHKFDDEEVNMEHKNSYHGLCYLEDFLDDDKGLENHPVLVDNRHPLEEILEGENQELRGQLFGVLHQELEKLTPNQRKTVDKIFYEGLNHSELAREEGVSETAIRHRLRKIYSRLRKNIQKGGSNWGDFSVNK